MVVVGLLNPNLPLIRSKHKSIILANLTGRISYRTTILRTAPKFYFKPRSSYFGVVLNAIAHHPAASPRLLRISKCTTQARTTLTRTTFVKFLEGAIVIGHRLGKIELILFIFFSERVCPY